MPREGQPEILSHLQFESSHDLRGSLQESFGLLTPLTNMVFLIRQPSPVLSYDTLLQREVEEFTNTRHALPIEHIKLCLTEGRSQFVFDDSDTCTIPYHLLATFQHIGPSHIETY